MGLLCHTETGRTCTLGGRVLVGRGPLCSIRLDDLVVSGEHALLKWAQDQWWLHDLHSRNGTWLDGSRLTPGEPRAVTAASAISFGKNDGSTWTLLRDGPPMPRAVSGASILESVGGLLLLPSDDDPEISVFRGEGGGWLCDSNAEQVEIADLDEVRAGGRLWRLHLPPDHAALDPTLRAEREPLAVTFRVSSDEEYVELDVEEAGRLHKLGNKSFNYLLLTLARERLAEARRSEESRGWLHQADLAYKLRLSDSTINVQIHRARHRLARAGVQAAASLVVRRSRTRQLRFGTDAIQIERL